ncbi:MAG: hypothetical protein AAGF56_04840, partial [Pseudomonadota bacterium]
VASSGDAPISVFADPYGVVTILAGLTVLIAVTGVAALLRRKPVAVKKQNGMAQMYRGPRKGVQLHSMKAGRGG